jgi:hypothetical protein
MTKHTLVWGADYEADDLNSTEKFVLIPLLHPKHDEYITLLSIIGKKNNGCDDILSITFNNTVKILNEYEVDLLRLDIISKELNLNIRSF